MGYPVTLLRLTRPRAAGWTVIAAAFVAVWLGARQIWILVAASLALLPAQLLACRAILAERAYPVWFAWFSLLFGPMGVLVVLGLPPPPKHERRR